MSKLSRNIAIFAVYGWFCGAIYKIPPGQFAVLTALMLAVLVNNMLERRCG